MCKYLITFKGEKQAEREIKKMISSYNSLQVFSNVWFIDTSKKASIIGDELKDIIGEDENIFITEISTNRDCWLNLAAGDFLNN